VHEDADVHQPAELGLVEDQDPFDDDHGARRLVLGLRAARVRREVVHRALHRLAAPHRLEGRDQQRRVDRIRVGVVQARALLGREPRVVPVVRVLVQHGHAVRADRAHDLRDDGRLARAAAARDPHDQRPPRRAVRSGPRAHRDSTSAPQSVLNSARGTPTRAYSMKPSRTPRAAARSATIRLAMDPIRMRLPANVALMASSSHSSRASGSVGTTGAHSSTAGTLDTRFESTSMTPLTAAARSRPWPSRRGAAAAVSASTAPVVSRPRMSTKSAAKNRSRGHSTRASAGAGSRRATAIINAPAEMATSGSESPASQPASASAKMMSPRRASGPSFATGGPCTAAPNGRSSSSRY